MAKTSANNYGGEWNGDTYTASFSGAAEPARMAYTGRIHTKGEQRGPLFQLDANSDGRLDGKTSTSLSTHYSTIFIDTSDGIQVKQEPL